jgi:hypothetical protein
MSLALTLIIPGPSNSVETMGPDQEAIFCFRSSGR